ncbi:MAG: hypothetical protein KME52_16120 [Desmonostoc geniculatum HA4340-LM1]|jgi:hypothetical protein|nr:hypothetical protein [Desmonostoc geniculatum HA4340-LM1]
MYLNIALFSVKIVISLKFPNENVLEKLAKVAVQSIQELVLQILQPRRG